MKSGDPLPAHRYSADPAAMAKLAVILRDPNPIHLDPAAAAAAGLGDRVINQGPANLAYLLNMLTATFPTHRLKQIESRYLANVASGDVVEAGGFVESMDDRRIVCQCSLTVIDGPAAVTATAVLVPR